MEERTIHSETIYQGRVVGLRVETVVLPDGTTTRREIVQHGGAVGIVAVNAQQEVLLVRQYRKAAEDYLLEIPAGGIEPGEDIEVCVLRELEEETGFTAESIHPLTAFFTAPGFCTEYLYVYAATGLSPQRRNADDDENIELLPTPLHDIPGLITSGQIRDAKSIAGLLAYLYLDHAP